jgi:hypothetical protein
VKFSYKIGLLSGLGLTPFTDSDDMTKLFEHAVETARSLPPDVQDDIARVVLKLAGDGQPGMRLIAEEKASFAKSRGEAARREFATDEQVRAIWAKHGL